MFAHQWVGVEVGICGVVPMVRLSGSVRDSFIEFLSDSYPELVDMAETQGEIVTITDPLLEAWEEWDTHCG